MSPSSSPSAPQLALVVLFGTSACLYAVFWALQRLTTSDAADAKDHISDHAQLLPHPQPHAQLQPQTRPTQPHDADTKLSKPFNGDFDSFNHLTKELTLLGCIIGISYLAEHSPPFPHSGKDYNSDFFWFVVFLLGGFTTLTLHKHDDLAILGRAQTEEWKGWMQFIFLIYHYFHAELVYNSVRVMITCYVWMTGFGNFSFFYMKQDFSWVRVVQMLWRLNMTVLVLCMAHNNTYILYYICPLHTFFFLMVYVIMRVKQDLNRTKWGIRWKLFVAGCIIFLVWDTDVGIFQLLFGWLGKHPTVGANNGTQWEWYFRTSLDHWSTLLGMIFALNYPMTTSFFKKMEAEPPNIAYKIAGVAGVIFLALLALWASTALTEDKLSYNMTNAYYGIVPLTSYLFLRNIHPSLRCWVSGGLHDLGKTTLETYLLQHHVWLTSNAKTILTLIPNSPYLNFGLCTILFFFLSQKLYRVTMSLRGMILPDDRDLCLRNGVYASGVLLVVYTIGVVLHSLKASFWFVIFSCLVTALIVLVLAKRFAPCADDKRLVLVFSNMFKFAGVCLAVLGVVIAQNHFAGTNGSNAVQEITASVSIRSGQIGRCTSLLTSGIWHMSDECGEPALALTCVAPQWVWNGVERDCQFGQVSTSHAQSMFQSKLVLFVGDSITRNVFYAFNAMLDGTAGSTGAEFEIHNYSAIKHADKWKFHESCNTTVGFLWRPYLADFLESEFHDAWLYGPNNRIPDAVFLGVGMWDLLYYGKQNRATDKVDPVVNKLKDMRESSFASPTSKRPVVSWLLPTSVVDEAVPQGEKKGVLTAAHVAEYSRTLLESKLPFEVDFLIDGRAITKDRRDDTTDGIHYNAFVYRVLAQIYTNGIKQYPAFQSSNIRSKGHTGNIITHQTKHVGSMASPIHGFAMLALITGMLFYMDAFFGIARATLYFVGGISLSHDEVYAKFITKPPLPGP